MAFCNRIGGVMKQIVSQNGAANMNVQVASMFNNARFLSTKIFVGGLSWGTDDQSLRDAFSGFGEVIDARVVTDRDTGRSRGFGFVNFASDESANSALTAMDGQPLNGRNIRVSYANERPSAPRGDFGNRGLGGNGGY